MNVEVRCMRWFGGLDSQQSGGASIEREITGAAGGRAGGRQIRDTLVFATGSAALQQDRQN